MIRRCPDCAAWYDDAQRSTLCPHDRILPSHILERKDLAAQLLGKPVRWAHDVDGSGGILRVQSIGWDGMVTVTGFTGEFAPHLFRVVEEARA